MSASKEKAFRPAQRLRTKLTAIMVVLLGIACLIIGLSSYITLEKSLMGQLSSRLDEASHRAVSFKPGGKEGNFDSQNSSFSSVAPQGGEEQMSGCDLMNQGVTPLDAPGQGSGTLSVCIQDGSVVFSGVLDSEGSSQELSQTDISALEYLDSDASSQEVRLEAGNYLVKSQQTQSGTVVITGIPMHDTQRTLAVLGGVIFGGSLVVIVIAGFLGSWIIRRTMKPLERVSEVATGVAQSNLETEIFSNTQRVHPKDANPNSEVGAVGYALNQLLDSVQNALESRQRTEDQMRVFIADASHELRTPLAAIKGYADLMKMTEDLSASGEQSVQRIDSQTQRMSRLVEDLLLLARLDEGREPVHQEIDLTMLLMENVMDLQVAAPSHKWVLDLPAEPIEVVGDPSQIQQVLLNLLSNARKHTEEGTRVTAGLQLSANRREAIMTVVDNGQGIEPEFIDKIFDRFTRADKARSGSDGTTGLGLPIVKAIVEAHGGSIDVSSKPGRTEFAVRLPLYKS